MPDALALTPSVHLGESQSLSLNIGAPALSEDNCGSNKHYRRD